MNKQTITIDTIVQAPIEKVWQCWSEPEHITKWCHASDDWEAPHAESDLRVGGRFMTRMQAKDGSEGFDFNGRYTDVRDQELVAYDIEGGRHVVITFTEMPEGVKVTETFDPEDINSADLQRSGWQAILDNFKTYTESV